MPPRKKVTSQKSVDSKTQVQAPVQEEARQAAASTRAGQKPFDEDAARSKYLSEKFHPKAVEFVKERFGLDLANPKAVSLSDLYDIAQGKVTRPMEIVVTPLAYDRAQRKDVEMPRIKSVASLRFVFPKEDGKPVAPDMSDKKKRIFVATVPCRPMVERAEGFDSPQQAPAGERELVKFTPQQIQALEGIGINRDRLFGGFNGLSADQKADIAAGRKFEVDGAVRIGDGMMVNVIGEARLVPGEDGRVEARFMPAYPEERSAGLVPDLEAGRRQGVLELDFTLRTSNGKAMTDVNGVPYLNDAAKNLIDYGMAMGPVVGYVHTRKQDEKTGEWKDRTERHNYEVTVVNGNLYATPMKEVPDLRPDGTQITYTDRSGKEKVQTHPEVASAIVKDGKVYVNGQNGQKGKALEFASPEDQKNYLLGKPAVVKDAVYHDFKSKTEKVYDGVAVCDNRSAGFGKVFTPSTSQALMEKMKEAKSEHKTKKFSFRV